LRQFIPKGLNHSFFTSGRDEVLDKGLRALRFHRPKADIAIGFTHQWFGQVSAAARSLSHKENQKEPFSWFNWPHIAHPNLIGDDESLKILKNTLDNINHDNILGIILELIGEKSSLKFSNYFLEELDIIRKKTNIPLVFSETASGFFRNGHKIFLTDNLDIKPDMVLWFTGGQLGHIFVQDNYYVDKPLTLISTWDGDEISSIRSYNNLLAAKNLGEKNQEYINILDNINSSYIKFGMGYWRGFYIKKNQKIKDIINQAKKKKIFFARGFDNILLVCPPLDLSKERISYLVKTLNQLLN
jgi:4-aminobutyrate aminotransferase-like enzyme